MARLGILSNFTTNTGLFICLPYLLNQRALMAYNNRSDTGLKFDSKCNNYELNACELAFGYYFSSIAYGYISNFLKFVV
jgi:hypothetical protein